MPPKKRSAGPAGTKSRAKKPRPSVESAEGSDNTSNDTNDTNADTSNDANASNAANTPAAPAIPIPRNKRWAKVSGSANVEDEFQLELQNPVKAFAFVTMCRPPFPNGGDSDDDGSNDDGSDDDDDDDDDGKEKKCDGGKTCLCEKPAADHPDHVWKLSSAGKRKFFVQYTHFALRCPDNFDMYTFNDHTGYGVLEMVQNLILDFEEASLNVKVQWAICEALAFFLQTWMFDPLTGIDDGACADATSQLVGRLFVSMLARLEREKLLSKDSEIPNLGLIMALFMVFGHGGRDSGLMEESKREALGPAKDKKKWEPHAFDSHILAYARKYDIDLVGPHRINKAVADADGDVDLPVLESNSTAQSDPFGFAKALKKYKSDHGGITAFLAQTKNSAVPIGGDNLDITTWTSAKRKSKAFNKKDPLGKKELDALKQGMVLTLG